MRVENTVFISYRRTHIMHARAIYLALTARGYDVFLDFESIDAGAFERIILAQIDARAHFVLILTPSALERCADPSDWLRREIERAMKMHRNIVPLLFDGFDFGQMDKYLTGELARLPEYNGIDVPSAYFEEAMDRLDSRFLSQPLDTILHPTTPDDLAFVADQVARADSAPEPTVDDLQAEAHYEQGFARLERGDMDGAIEQFTHAILLKKTFAEAYFRRSSAYMMQQNAAQALRDVEQAVSVADPDDPHAWAYQCSVLTLKKEFELALEEANQAITRQPTDFEAYRMRAAIHVMAGNMPLAIEDLTEAVRLNPADYQAWHSRGYVHATQHQFEQARADYDAALAINPAYAMSYFNRGLTWLAEKQPAAAITDFDAALELNPTFVYAYIQRGLAYAQQKSFGKAFDDFDAALGINPNEPLAYNNRGQTREMQGDLAGAIADYKAALRVNPALLLAQVNLQRARLKRTGKGLFNRLRGK